MELRNPILRVIRWVAGESFLAIEYLGPPCCIRRAYILVREKCIDLKIGLTVQVTSVHGYLFWNTVAFEGRHMALTELGVIDLGTYYSHVQPRKKHSWRRWAHGLA
jgi:hypothetical protein